jgi:hypothetical protein
MPKDNNDDGISPSTLQFTKLPPDSTVTPINTLTPKLILPTSDNLPTTASLPTRTTTSYPTIRSTTTTTTNFIKQCIVIQPETPLGNVANGMGTVSLNFLDVPPYLFNLRTEKKYDLPTKNDGTIYSMQESPNGKMLAYLEVYRDQAGDRMKYIWVVNSEAEMQAITSFDVEWTWWRWLDNEHIEAYWYKAPTPGTVVVLNPFTAEKKVIVPNFSNLYPGIYERPHWTVMYSSDLQRALYLSNGDDKYPSGVIMWDTSSKKALWQMSSYRAWANRPAWSPKGDQAAVIVDSTLFRIDRDGRTFPLSLEKYDDSGDFNWSPDGSYIAFWGRSSQQADKAQLLLLDTRTNQITDYCIESESYNNLAPVWSPDSQQFVINIVARKYPMDTETIFVNIKEFLAFQIPTNTTPGMWMRSMP